MKTLFIILLNFVMLLQPLSKLLLVAEYQVNKNYIAEFLCVNKNKPKLQCEGKCQLTKKLKAAEEHNEDLPAPVKQQLETPYFCQDIPAFSFEIHTVFKTKHLVFSSPEVIAPAFGIFHPPCFLV